MRQVTRVKISDSKGVNVIFDRNDLSGWVQSVGNSELLRYRIDARAGKMGSQSQSCVLLEIIN